MEREVKEDEEKKDNGGRYRVTETGESLCPLKECNGLKQDREPLCFREREKKAWMIKCSLNGMWEL